MMRTRPSSATILAVAIAMTLVACGDGSQPPPGGSTASTSGPRPSSPAELRILEPKSGVTVDGTGVQLKVSLTGATLTDVTSVDISPAEGHLHVSVDDQLISMTSGLEQILPDLTAGSHVIRVEFVASDHAPFDPRVVTQAVFEVRG